MNCLSQVSVATLCKVLLHSMSLCIVNDCVLSVCLYQDMPDPISPPTHTHRQIVSLTMLAGHSVMAATHCPSGVDNSGKITQLQLHLWLKFTTAHTGSGPLAGPGSFEIRQQISFLTPFQFKDSSLAPSRRLGMVMVIAWQWNRQKVQRNLAIQKKTRPCGDERWRWKKKQEGERDGKI